MLRGSLPFQPRWESARAAAAAALEGRWASRLLHPGSPSRAGALTPGGRWVIYGPPGAGQALTGWPRWDRAAYRRAQVKAAQPGRSRCKSWVRLPAGHHCPAHHSQLTPHTWVLRLAQAPPLAMPPWALLSAVFPPHQLRGSWNTAAILIFSSGKEAAPHPGSLIKYAEDHHH